MRWRAGPGRAYGILDVPNSTLLSSRLRGPGGPSTKPAVGLACANSAGKRAGQLRHALAISRLEVSTLAGHDKQQERVLRTLNAVARVCVSLGGFTGVLGFWRRERPPCAPHASAFSEANRVCFKPVGSPLAARVPVNPSQLHYAR